MACKVKVRDEHPCCIDLDAPVLGARVIDNGSGGAFWGVWCQHCDAWHWHRPGEGHRRAHCHWSTSPYCRTGYNLVLRN